MTHTTPHHTLHLHTTHRKHLTWKKSKPLDALGVDITLVVNAAKSDESHIRMALPTAELYRTFDTDGSTFVFAPNLAAWKFTEFRYACVPSCGMFLLNVLCRVVVRGV